MLTQEAMECDGWINQRRHDRWKREGRMRSLKPKGVARKTFNHSTSAFAIGAVEASR
jgi:hypothetical protein